MSGSTLLTDHMEDLKFMIQEGNFLTCRSLATQYNLDINSSQTMLEEFFAASTGFRAIYMISGVVENFRRTFILATDEEVENAKKNFTTVTAVHIYSVQKDIPQNINTILSSTEMKHVQELMLESKSDDFLINNLSLITSLDIKLLPNGQHISTSENSSLQKSSSNDIRPAESLTTSASSAASKSRPTTTQNFFNAKSNKSAKNKEDVISENSTVPLKSTTPTTNSDVSLSNNQEATPATTTITGSKDGDDAEWDDGSGHQTKPKIKTKPIAVKKRVVPTAKEAAPTPPSLRLTLQRNQLSNAAIAALEDDEDTDDSEVEEEEEESEEKQQNGDEINQKVETPTVVGAMDDFTTTGNGSLQKKKTKVLVEKTFADERGYLVTEMVYEEIEVDNNEQNPTHKTSNSSTIIKSTNIEENGNHEEGIDTTTTTRKSTLIPSKTNSKKKVMAKATSAVESSSSSTTTTTSAPQQKSIASFFMRK